MNKPEKGVLIITYDMIPFSKGWGDCQRMYFLAEYLQNTGFDVNVFYSRGKYYGDFGKPANFRLIPIGSASTSPIESTSGLKGQILQLTTRNVKNILHKLHINSIEKFIFNDPNPGMGILGYLFTRNARECIKKTIIERSIDYVIISGPPFSLFRLAPFIKKHFPDKKIIFDYRDPWNAIYSTFFSRLIEKKYLKFADKIVFLNDRMLNDTMKRYGLSESKCEIVINGYSQNDWDEVQKNFFLSQSKTEQPENKRMIISYIGSYSLQDNDNLDFSIFLDAFKKFKNNKKVLLLFVGGDASRENRTIKENYTDCVDYIQMISNVNLKKALNFMLSCDILLVLYTNNERSRYMLTGKFFDYIRSGKIIFGIGGNKDTYFLNWIEKHNLGLGCLNQSSEILRCLEILYEHWEQGTLHQLRQDVNLNVEDFSRDAQNHKYLNILQNFERDFSGLQ